MDTEQAVRLAKEDAAKAIYMAKHLSDQQPILFITGNNFVPPLRGFGNAEVVWQAAYDAADLWEAYVLEFARALDQANVYLDSPEYDNALYVVDMDRWQYVDDNESDTLSGEWEQKCD